MDRSKFDVSVFHIDMNSFLYILTGVCIRTLGCEANENVDVHTASDSNSRRTCSRPRKPTRQIRILIRSRHIAADMWWRRMHASCRLSISGTVLKFSCKTTLAKKSVLNLLLKFPGPRGSDSTPIRAWWQSAPAVFPLDQRSVVD